jgi:hypothetical protein
MVPGLDRFQNYFKDYQDQYILIGGAACDKLMEAAGLDFRATKDLDIVLCVEVLDAAFVKHFWEFIQAGKYKHRNKKSGEPCFYRFTDPVDDSFPYMLELFSKKPEALEHKDMGHLTPIPVEDDLSSLSAILLDGEYYDFLHAHKKELDGLTLIDEIGLIPLKAKAWMENTDRKAAGQKVRSWDITKHRGDIPRLFRLLNEQTRIQLPLGIKRDMEEFFVRMVDEESKVDLSVYGVTGISYHEFLARLKQNYGLD